jgi:hypothetical protein
MIENYSVFGHRFCKIGSVEPSWAALRVYIDKETPLCGLQENNLWLLGLGQSGL